MTLGRDICGVWDDAIGREWLVTNGLGGYACGTVAGANTRRYHGFLMASLNPPVERTLLVAKVDLGCRYLGQAYQLSTNEFSSGAIDPRGFVHLESFGVVDGVPHWRYAMADAVVEQRVFMAPGANTSYMHLTLVRGAAPIRIEFKPLVTYRDFHSHGRGARPFRSAAGRERCTVTAFDGARPFHLEVSRGEHQPADTWYWNFFHREEFGKGLDALEDLWGPGTFTAEVGPGESVYFAASTETVIPAADLVLADLRARARRARKALPESAPGWIDTLACASDQFIVRRGAAERQSLSVIAGYPWFADWGRDTMISLPGLTTTLGRHDMTANILRTFAGFVDGGMLPNRFPDVGDAPEYNTADATLWMFQAVHEHLAAKRDPDLARDLFPVLTRIVHAHVDGTRFGIRVDPTDGLLRAGEPGVQLTWMDAKQGDHVFTPRVGKPVEINALWLNALDVTVRLATRLRNGPEKRFAQDWLTRAEAHFGRFWNADRACLYDVIDVDGGTGVDPSIRPNQLIAVSLPRSTLDFPQMRGIVDICARELLVSHGLRSLSPDDAAYIGRYDGNQWQRDAAYHQGTAWSWLLGPFARAHFRAYGDARLAQSFLEPTAQHLDAACLGSVSEIFDGDAPHIARGCFAQAWGVAEILRTWVYLERQIKND